MDTLTIIITTAVIVAVAVWAITHLIDKRNYTSFYDRLLGEAKANYDKTIDSMKEDQKAAVAALREDHDRTLKDQIAAIKTEMEAQNAKIQKEREEALKREAAETFKTITGGLGENIKEMTKSFEEQKKQHVADFASMKTKFEETAKAMSHQSDEIGRKADGLANALRRNHKDVGNWGEVQLHNILDEAGFVRGRDYDTEVTLKNEQGERIYNDESGKAMRPDAILHFPDGYDVIVDSKVSLDAMLDYTAEDANEQQKENAAERNLRAVKEQIKNLSAKSYHDYHKKKGIKTVDYVMMFIPNYGVFQLAKQKEPNLFSDAFRQNVLITTEETIMPFLHMIHTAWINQEQINGMEEIVKQATYMVERVATFAEAHHKMGDKLRDAQKEFDRCDAMLKEGGQSILHAAHAVTGCGIKISPKKNLPELEG